MKGILTIIVCFITILGVEAQNTYYWYKGTQKQLTTTNKKKFVLVNKATDTIAVKNQAKRSDYVVESFKELKVTNSSLNSQSSLIEYWTVVESNNNDISLPTSNISYSAPFFLTQDSTLVGLSHLFYVKLNSPNDVGLLENMAISNNVTILGNNQYMPLWFTLSCNQQSKGNALQMANVFYQSGMFSAAEPDILVDDLLQCANDTYFANQWALHNTGQYGGIAGIDINYCEAQSITTGISNIVVAVLDNGVELNHPDLTNMHHLSYDTESGTSPSRVLGNHGTPCAGIIGATTNNNIGVAGIAQNSPIMSISNSLNATPNSRMKRADGVNYAWQNGASIISNSWGSSVQYEMIDDAINNALTQGRNGKGCVVVFASGNNNASSVGYPSSLDGVISVGAMSPCGERKNPSSCDTEGWGSNYGSGLSVVAPGVLIPTTDIGNSYKSDFNGTSAACPHVSGVAALILSVNPNLTRQEVRDIIEQTAQKVRTDLYTYSSSANHPNGTWNNQMGYGLVDAYAAVKKASTIDLYSTDNDSDNGDEPNTTNEFMWASPGIWIEDMEGNRVDNLTSGKKYQVCVGIHNRSAVRSLGTERLIINWAKAGVSLSWSDSWLGKTFFDCSGDRKLPKGGYVGDSLGTVIRSYPGYSSKVVRVPWTPPHPSSYSGCSEAGSQPWHFCLLARIHDGNDIPNEDSTNIGMTPFVAASNNVVWRNISVMQGLISIGSVSVSNPFDISKKFNFRYIANPNKQAEVLNKFAEVYLTLSPGLYKQWEKGGFAGKGFKIAGENRILLTQNDVVLSNITINPKEDYLITAQVNFFSQDFPKDSMFTFDLVQYAENDGKNELIGGERYIAIRNKYIDFNAKAMSDTTVFASEPVIFEAEDIGKDAIYTWYNQGGDTVAQGLTLTVAPNTPQSYTLEVLSKADGYKDYDTVKANIRKGAITIVSPNPATSEVNIEYRLSNEVQSASVRIVNTLGIAVAHASVSNLQSSVTLNVQNLSRGQYSVQLLSNNTELLDSKTLIIK